MDPIEAQFSLDSETSIPIYGAHDSALADQRLSCYEIVRSERFELGRPYQQTRLIPFYGPLNSVTRRRLKAYRNWNGHSYAESHIEEWISRLPQALFPGEPIPCVVGSQNYAHLPEKIDLLLLDTRNRVHIVEIKAEQV